MQGKFDKYDCESYIGKVKMGMEPFGVKLKKIKVSTTINNAHQNNETPTHNKSIKEL